LWACFLAISLEGRKPLFIMLLSRMYRKSWIINPAGTFPEPKKADVFHKIHDAVLFDMLRLWI